MSFLRNKLTFYSKTLIAIAIMALMASHAYSSFENSTALGLKKKKSSYQLVHNLSYQMSSDALDNNDQKLYNHGIFYGGTLFFFEKLYATLGLGANYHSVDQTIIEQDNGAFRLSDLSIGLGTKGLNLHKGSKDKVTLYNNIRSAFPLSDRSQNEGYKAVPSTSADLAYQRGPLGLVLTGQYSYVMNSFETNQAGLYNLRSSSVAGLTARYNYKRFRFQYSYRFGVLEYMDGNRLGSSGNTFSISAMITKRFWAGASTSNINYIEEQFVDVWFYDPFRRFYNLRLGVTF